MTPSARAALRITASVLLAGACDATAPSERFSETEPVGLTGMVRASELEPGAPTSYGAELPYRETAWSVYAGERLYAWLNCVGCHANGGGGIGPPLIDDEWIYGSEPLDIFATIWQGRPNGMPAFGTRVGQQQVWLLVAYVRALAGLTPPDLRVLPVPQLGGDTASTGQDTAQRAESGRTITPVPPTDTTQSISDDTTR